MKTKQIITGVLLLFVAASVVALAWKQLAPKQKSGDGPAISGTKVVAYYFHGAKRCPTCLKIEKYSHTAIDSFFTQDQKREKLEFVTIDYDQPQNEHYWNDYRLTAQSLVLVRYENGQQQNWENLTQIWDLVGEEDQFYAYVRDGVDRFLKELP